MKKTSFVIGSCFVALIMVFLLSLLPTLISGVSFGFSNDLPDPSVTYGEFPFKLIYSIDGQQYIEDGTFACEYDGVSMNTAYGKYRNWKGYIKGSDKSYLVLYKNDKVEVRCNIGEPEYYMNDTQHPEYEYIDLPVKPYLYNLAMPESVIKAQYKIELIEWTLSSPITNTFD